MQLHMQASLLTSSVCSLSRKEGSRRTDSAQNKDKPPCKRVSRENSCAISRSNRIKTSFWEVHDPSTNADRQLTHFMIWTSFEERLPCRDDHIPLKSFVYHS